MENKSYAFYAGLFTFGLLIAGIAIGLWFGRDSQQMVRYQIATEASVSGLSSQATVRFRGLNVGRVRGVGFDQTNPRLILIDIEVAEGTPVSKTTFARLAQQGLTGIAVIELDDEATKPQLLASDDVDGFRIPMRPGAFDDLLTASVTALNSINTTLKDVQTLFSGENRDAARQVMENANKTVVSLGTMADQVAGLAGNANQSLSRIQGPDGIVYQATRSLETINWLTTTLARDTLPTINDATSRASRVVDSMDQTVLQVRKNPQALLFGVNPQPGPGEEGFSGFDQPVSKGAK